MRIDESSLAWAEVHERIVVVRLLFRQGVHWGASLSSFHYLGLERDCSIFSGLECLVFVSVVLVAYGERCFDSLGGRREIT